MLGSFYESHRGTVEKLLEAMLLAVGHKLHSGYKMHAMNSREYRLDCGLRVVIGVLTNTSKNHVAVTIATRGRKKPKKKVQSGQQLISMLIAEDLSNRLIIHERKKEGYGTIQIDYSFISAVRAYIAMAEAGNTYMKNEVFKFDAENIGRTLK